MIYSDLPIYNAPNYAPLKPLLDLREKDEPAHASVNHQIRELYEEFNARDEAVIFSIAETAYTIASFIQGKQLWQRSYRGGGGWELVQNKNGDPNRIQSVNITQFQVTQMLKDIISSNPDLEPADMFKSYEYEKEVKASKAAWNTYESIFYNPWFLIQQGLGLITAGTSIEQVKYDASKKSFKIFREIWGETNLTLNEGFSKCFACGFEGRNEDLHSWETEEERRSFENRSPEEVKNDGRANLAALPQCPECGSFEVDGEEAQRENVPSVVGMEQFEIGDFVLNDIPIQSTRFDVSKRFEDSSYAITKQYIPTQKLKHLLGDFELGSGCDSDRGLDLLHKMARIGASIGGARQELSNDAETGDCSLLCTFSASPEILSEIKVGRFSEDKKTVSAGNLDTGQTYADLCPDGGTILGINGMKHIYGIFPAHHSKETSSAVYFAKPGGGTGRGAEDLIEIQKRKNRLDAQQTKAVDGAAPGYAFVEGAVDEKDIARMGFPNAKIPIRREFFNMTKDVNSFVRQFEPQQVAPQLFAYSQELDKLAQMTAHVVSMSDSVYGADNNTATGARILEATATAITIPFVQSKAGCRQRTAKNFLSAYKEIFTGVKRDFSLKNGGRGKQTSSIEVDGADINPDIEFEVVANSEIPQNFYTRKMDYATFTQILGGVEGVKMLKDADPQLFRTYSKAFNLDFGGDDYDQIQEICRMRMHQAFEMADMFGEQMEMMQSQMAGVESQVSGVGGQGSEMMAPTTPPTTPQAPPTTPQPAQQIPPPADTNSLTQLQNTDNNISAVQPEQAQIPPPPPEAESMLFNLLFENVAPRILPKEKNHPQKADWFAEFLDTDEALKLPEEKRMIVIEFILRHEEMERANRMAQMGLEQMGEFNASLPVAAMGKKLEQMSGELVEEVPASN